jgi:predicted short-subunit dehydrogenase-like oxidoreductase (DUF2520 family)
MQNPKVAIVGAGKVGSVLARALDSHGYQLAGIVSRTLESAYQLADQFGVAAGTRSSSIVQNAQIVFITTPDRCIGDVAGQIAKDNGFYPGQVVIHTSGCLPVEVLQPASEQGALIGCMHPLQSFANKELASGNLSGIYFALSGQVQMVEQAEKIVKAFGGKSFTILDKDKALYHAAACIVSNYTVSLMHWAGQIYGRFGLSPEESSAALLPLLQGTVNNIREMGPTQGLTGPISRGDGITVNAHIGILENETEKRLYKELGLYTLGVALEKGTIEERQAAILTEILSDRYKEELK